MKNIVLITGATSGTGQACATKFAVDALTKGIRTYTVKRGIKVNQNKSHGD